MNTKDCAVAPNLTKINELPSMRFNWKIIKGTDERVTTDYRRYLKRRD